GLGRVIAGVPPAAYDSVEFRLVLIGDAGLPAPGGEPVLKALQEEISYDSRSFVVFLGDNVYPRGMVLDSTAAERRENERIIDAQLAPLVATGVHGIMLPGNHDWATGTAGGWDAIRAEGRYVSSRSHRLVEFLPENGCPGPVVRDFGETVRLIILDTQWWLQVGHPRPHGASSRCRARTEQEVIDSLRADLASAGQRRTVVLSHHPLVSGGQHGGYFDWPTYLFPFHPWARQSGVFARQDVTGREYRTLIAAMVRAFAGRAPLIHAAGHEHNLQLLRLGGTGGHYQVVSGAGIYNHTTPTRAIPGTLYARRASGWTTVAFFRDGRVRIAYRTVDAEGKFKEEFSMWLDTPPFVRPPAPDSAAADSAAAAQVTPRAPAPAPPTSPAPPMPTPAPAPPPPPAPVLAGGRP
ncbi:MAG TPA: metallophosphoesterase, partial [Longimicrobium sp.]|nr:metallophosphoesterase [Longimicrobium sp.]